LVLDENEKLRADGVICERVYSRKIDSDGASASAGDAGALLGLDPGAGLDV
jgi:hypothetical protein